jgi:hypothetical protein
MTMKTSAARKATKTKTKPSFNPQANFLVGTVFEKVRLSRWQQKPYTGDMMIAQRTLRGLAGSLVLTLGVVVLAPAMMVGMPLAAQTRGVAQRVVHGVVQDKDGASMKGAVVYLKDTRTSAVKSAIADDDGSYRFVQLAQNTDYELYAKSGDKTSKTRAISSFDTKNELTINLKID